jgi:anti-anti-sigma factor
MMTTAIEQAPDVRVSEDERGVTAQLSGDLTISNSAEVSAAVQRAWEEKGRPRRLVLDLQGVHHIDSSGAGALMEIRERLSQANSRLVVTGLADGPRKLLERTGILRLFEARIMADDAGIILPASFRQAERLREHVVEGEPKRRRHRVLWSLIWLCVIVGGLIGIGVAAWPTLQNYHAQLEQVPILSGLMKAMDQRVGEVEQNIKERFTAFESRLNGHIRAERRRDIAADRRAAELKSRLDAVEAAQRATDQRIGDLQQQLEQQQQQQQSSTTEPPKGGPQQ